MKYELVNSSNTENTIPVYENYTNKGIGMEFLDFNEIFERRMKQGLDFKIDTTVDYDTAITSGKVVDPSDDIYMKRSIYSYRYGIKPRDSMEAIPYKYRCRCTKTYGKLYDGMLCPDCNTVVEEVKDDIGTVGWMMIPEILGKMPSPIGLTILKKILGDELYRKMMKHNAKKGSKKKKEVLPFLCELTDKSKMEIFLNKQKKNKKKKYLIDLFLKNFDKIYSNVYPVITEKVRSPIVKVENGIPRMSVPDISGLYTVISTSFNDVNNEGVLHTLQRKNKLYTNILKNMVKVDEILINHLGGAKAGGSKSKFIRGLLLGSRVPYSGRAVIVPSDTSSINNTQIPAIIYKRIFKQELKMILIQLGYDMHEVLSILNREHIKDDEELALLKKTIKILDPYVLINRQPSLNVSNILSYKVEDIVDTYNTHLSVMTAGLMNFDFDGDTVAIYPIKEKFKKSIDDTFSPYSFSITYDRKVNNRLGLINNYKAIFFKMTY